MEYTFTMTPKKAANIINNRGHFPSIEEVNEQAQ